MYWFIGIILWVLAALFFWALIYAGSKGEEEWKRRLRHRPKRPEPDSRKLTKI